MKKNLFLSLFLIVLTAQLMGQQLTQTVRGTLVDADSKMPLIGATVIIDGSQPVLGAVTDTDGNFRINDVPVGRITLKLSYIGYENKSMPNINVSSGKEVFLQLTMVESLMTVDEVVVRANGNKGEPLNEMALLSGRSISVEESKRFAGGFDDPSRVVTNYAGVSNTADGSSDIIVRGNAPKYMKWRLEGTEIASPYHFDDQNASFGGLSMLNNNLLAASDFFTGAFPAQYGDVLSSVFDIRLRPGNNEKLETTVGLGIIGADLTIEGPYKKGYKGSFIANYRYSTASLIQDLGLVDLDGSLDYQDFSFKTVLPTNKAGQFSVFAQGGLNGWETTMEDPYMTISPDKPSIKSDITKDSYKDNYLINTGLKHTISINNASFLNTRIAYSGSGISDDMFQYKTPAIDSQTGEQIPGTETDRKHTFDSRLIRSTYRASLDYHAKINKKHKLQIGSEYALHQINFNQRYQSANQTAMHTMVDFNGNVPTLQNYITWKYRMNESLTLVAGLHNFNVLYNNKSTLEPRLAFSWQINNANTVSLAYGKHSTMESLHHYFVQLEDENGNLSKPNTDLDVLKAHHFVLGYEKRFSANMVAKFEAYYQYLYDLPVENNDTSYFATLNEGIDFRYVDLVNEGTGKNYGVEITVERFFDNNYFFLVNTSLYNSTYKSLEGIERNTRFNKNYLANILFGKEFHNLGKKDNQTLSINCKIFFEGAQKQLPLLRDADGNLAVDPENNSYWDYDKAYEKGLDALSQINLSLSYKFNRRRSTHELFLDLQNLTNSQGRITEYYDDTQANSVGYLQQFGFFPNLMYRIYL